MKIISMQIEIVNIYSDILQEREKLQSQKFRENIPQSEGPVHPSHNVGVMQHISVNNCANM